MRINFFGDVCLDGIDTDGFSIDRRIVALVAAADCNVANLESPLTSSADGLPYQAHLIKAEPKPNAILDLFEVFSLANNHIMDYRQAGFSDTTAFLEALGKGHFGAGIDLNNSFTPYTFERDGQRVALLGFTRWHRATRHAPGATPDRVRRLTRLVGDLSRHGYFVVVYPHWNYEYVEYPAPSNRRLARRLIDAGADLVVGSHPHIIQGIEQYKGKWIFHSLGNFVFDPTQLPSKENSKVNEAFVLSINLHPNLSYDHEITPIWTNAGGVAFLQEEKRAALLRRLDQISAVLQDDVLSKRKFYEEAARPVAKMNKKMGKMIRQKGVMYILSRLHRIQLEDLRIKLHSMVAR